jgi:hypothetical protein
VKNNFSVGNIMPAFIGPEVPVSDTANPPAGVKVAALEKFHTIGEAVITAYRDVAASALTTTLLADSMKNLSDENCFGPLWNGRWVCWNYAF